jgi:hypothetical protein
MARRALGRKSLKRAAYVIRSAESNRGAWREAKTGELRSKSDVAASVHKEQNRRTK